MMAVIAGYLVGDALVDVRRGVGEQDHGVGLCSRHSRAIRRSRLEGARNLEPVHVGAPLRPTIATRTSVHLQ